MGAGGLDDSGERAFPADVLATEGESPAVYPAGPDDRSVWCTFLHLGRIEVAAVGGVHGHGVRLSRALSSRPSRPG